MTNFCSSDAVSWLTFNNDAANVKHISFSFLEDYMFKSLKILGSYITEKPFLYIKDILTLRRQTIVRVFEKCVTLIETKRQSANIISKDFSLCVGDVSNDSSLMQRMKRYCIQLNLNDFKMWNVFFPKTSK